jgi:hypothetical protein
MGCGASAIAAPAPGAGATGTTERPPPHHDSPAAAAERRAPGSQEEETQGEEPAPLRLRQTFGAGGRSRDGARPLLRAMLSLSELHGLPGDRSPAREECSVALHGPWPTEEPVAGGRSGPPWGG